MIHLIESLSTGFSSSRELRSDCGRNTNVNSRRKINLFILISLRCTLKNDRAKMFRPKADLAT